MRAARPEATARGRSGDGEAERPLALRAQLATLGRGVAGSPERGVLAGLTALVVAVLLMTAAAQVALNRWNAPFYNAVQARDVEAFGHELVVFFAIAGSLLVLNVAQMWLNLTLQLKLRAGLMHDLLALWLKPLAAFKLAHAAGLMGANPDQRLDEDSRHLAELSTTLAIGLLQASVLLAVFTVVLWQLSAGFALTFGGHRLAVPGYMVWAAAAYALVGSLASIRVGSSLIRFNAERYGREAELRAALVRVSDHVDTIALHRGETGERRSLTGDLDHVLAAMRLIVTATVRLTWVTAGYGWLTQIVPILVASPIYFSGQISFGELMMAVGAFNQVQSSLRWFVDNFGIIADWRATLLRVADFRHAVLGSEELHGGAGRIAVQRGEPGRLVLDHLAVAQRGGCARLDASRVEIASGERVQITGDSGDAQTALFRALAGLWPWGEGRIVLPADESFMHVGRRPYLRSGRLGEVLAYPDDDAGLAAERFTAALAAVGLERLAPRLGESARWDQELGDQDQQRLAFARLLVRRPAWIVIDQALEVLDDETRERVTALFCAQLGAAAIINIGRPEPLFTRVVALIDDPDGCRLPGGSHAAAADGTGPRQGSGQDKNAKVGEPV